MQPESLFPHLQEAATCPYPEPDRSSPYPQSTFLRSILILSSHLSLGQCLVRNMFKFLRWGVVSISPKPTLEHHPLPAVRDRLFSAVVTETHLSRM
jgi:hypothetical protein